MHTDDGIRFVLTNARLSENTLAESPGNGISPTAR